MQPGQPADAQALTPVRDAIFRELEQRLTRKAFDNWFRNKVTLTIEDGLLTVGVDNLFKVTWLQKEFRAHVQAAATAALGPSAQVQFVVDPALVPVPADKTARLEKPSGSQSAETQASEPASANGKSANGKSMKMGRRYADLKDFVVGPSNALAATAAREVVDQPGVRHNPLVIHGGVGIGKTHLLEGIYQGVRRGYPALQSMYLTAEAFANYFTEALRDRGLPGFRQRFRNIDVFVVDGIEFLNNKKGLQEEFLHTFRHLESHGKQIIISCDRHPRLLTKCSDELTTRLLSGMVCRIEAPETDTRRTIVATKALRLRSKLSPAICDYVAQRFTRNVRELEGALNCLDTYAEMLGRKLSLSAARQALADLERDCVKVVRLSDIEDVICRLFGVKSDELRSARRSRSLSHPRMLAMFLSRKHTQSAYSEIGAHFGGRNHSTVIAAEKKVQSWLSSELALSIANQQWTATDLISALEQQLMAS